MFKIDFIALNESRRIQLQLVTNRIKIGRLKTEIQPAKGCVTLGIPPVTISFETIFFLTVEVYL